ncbi:hypothetical protein Q5H92_06890 [Hymenobacter sp. M29]|uniref:Uncharacterized protein n=1 Tax=Hymenobacter mellowenesis TaxID=3063995 RepID=A0ABT9A8A4_9BACT|nr:hypothetical protein [Hymenobacter sp. M29]MDO7846074.1 hypothetical protein [Hymenobacter sp. M29]
MRNKTILLITAVLLASFPRGGVGQCLDTRTLLDSIYSIGLNRLNAIGQLRDSNGKPGMPKGATDSVFRISFRDRGDIYQPLVLDKIFKRSAGISSPLDGAYLHIGHDYKDKYCTRIRFKGATKFSLVLISDAFHNLYLASLNLDFAIISFVAFDTENFPIHASPTSANRHAHTLVQSGITSTLSEHGVITQFAWSGVKPSQTRPVLQNKSKAMRYRIDANGKISLDKVVQRRR